MRAGPLETSLLAALLVLSGCAALPGADDGGPSPEEFPNASAINESVYDRHAAVLATTNFTATFEAADRREILVANGTAFRWLNSTERVFVEPGASQYLYQRNGTLDTPGTHFVESVYSNGSGGYVLKREDNESTVTTANMKTFNESGDFYLWQGWKEFIPTSDGLYFISEEGVPENITFERKGIETFEGLDVMRYEANGADALPDSIRSRDPYTHTRFSATILLDADGVIRYYEVEVDTLFEERGPHNRTLAITVTDVGSTDVETPDWAANATADS